MALRGIQEYIARDVNNIARVEDESNIVSFEGNIFLYPQKKSHPILLLLIIWIIITILDGPFRGIHVQEYITLDANNITLVIDSGNIVRILGNIFLYSPQGHSIFYNYIQD